MAYSDFETVIGLEIHAQLFTKTKAFAPASTEFGSGDNQNVSVICAGHPGTLPVLNHEAVNLAIRTGLALNCKIKNTSVFARKQYFYPDLPKGYQISQFDLPLCENGYVEFILDGQLRKVNLERAHMEEDAGKSTHAGTYSLINYNRAGVPLLEIVSAPDMRSPQEAAEYARAVRQILRYTEVCDGNLEEGSMRCDCNVSVRKKGETKLGVKVELKNINSFRFIEKAIEYEVQRQIDAIESGTPILQETRLYDSTKNKTYSMRSKEEANDYRYFPDPDLLPLQVSDEWISAIKSKLPELPLDKVKRFQSEYSLPIYDAEVLCQERIVSDYFEKVATVCKNPKATSNWIMGDFMMMLNEAKLEINQAPVSTDALAEMISLIDKGTISGKMAKQVFKAMWESKKMPSQLVKELGLEQISDDSAIEKIIDEVLAQSQSAVAEYKSGKTKLFGFFVGQIMKASKGQANPDAVNKILKGKLES